MASKRPALGKHTTPAVYEHAQAVAEGFLIAAAQAQRLVTYGQVGDAIVRATGHQVDGRNWGHFLGDLVTRTHERYGAMLSAVVVSADRLRPGGGFTKLAVDLGLASGEEDELTTTDRLRIQLFKKLSQPI